MIFWSYRVVDRENTHLISVEIIDAVGPSGTLIDVSRGNVVNEHALIDALSDGRLGYAALDIFESEPNVPEAVVAERHSAATSSSRSDRNQIADW